MNTACLNRRTFVCVFADACAEEGRKQKQHMLALERRHQQQSSNPVIELARKAVQEAQAQEKKKKGKPGARAKATATKAKKAPQPTQNTNITKGGWNGISGYNILDSMPTSEQMQQYQQMQQMQYQQQMQRQQQLQQQKAQQAQKQAKKRPAKPKATPAPVKMVVKKAQKEKSLQAPSALAKFSDDSSEPEEEPQRPKKSYDDIRRRVEPSPEGRKSRSRSSSRSSLSPPRPKRLRTGLSDTSISSVSSAESTPPRKPPSPPPQRHRTKRVSVSPVSSYCRTRIARKKEGDDAKPACGEAPCRADLVRCPAPFRVRRRRPIRLHPTPPHPPRPRHIPPIARVHDQGHGVAGGQDEGQGRTVEVRARAVTVAGAVGATVVVVVGAEAAVGVVVAAEGDQDDPRFQALQTVR